MSKHLKTNKYLLTTMVLTIVVAGLTFGNLPGSPTPTTVQTIDGITYDFSDYKSMSHEQLALFNYLDTIVSSDYQAYGEWERWYAENYHGLHHYVLAFMDYAVSALFETTPGYRTDYYREFAFDLIKKMNTTEEDWGNSSIEWKEWTHPDYNYVDYYWPNDPDDPDAIYTGGWRGPANIMWTGHFALMESLYERNFNTGEFKDEITWFVNDWNNSLLTDGHGNPKEGGIWGTGLIPCEPYIVFSQCNSIPIVTTELYDSLYGSQYIQGGMWDYGLDFINTVMQDRYDLFMDGYYVDRPTASYYNTERLPDEIPGPALSLYADDGRCKVSSYNNGWSLAFLQHIQPEESLYDYPIFLEHFMKDVSGDMAYMMDTYNNPDGFGTYEILGSMFTMHLANQMGDYVTRDRLLNFLYSSYNKVWSADGREMHFDTMALEPFLQPVMAFGYLWANAPVTIIDLTDARPDGFWNYPYISEADDDNIWIYQAEWDPEKEVFILNIRVDQSATLVFDNFDSAPTAYSNGVAIGDLVGTGSGHELSLDAGQYMLVIK